jgi:hypothetical protein
VSYSQNVQYSDRCLFLLCVFRLPAHPLPLAPCQSRTLFCGLVECGVSLGGHEHLDLSEGSQHLNASCYPSTCITDILLSYKHPEVSFSMEQAGV